MEKSKLMTEEKEEEDRSTEFDNSQAGTPFDFNEVKKNMVTSLVFKNADISIYHAYSNQKQYTIVAYVSSGVFMQSTSSKTSSLRTSRSKIKARRTKPASTASNYSNNSSNDSQQDESLNIIQSFYKELQDLQGKNSDYNKNMMQILHIRRDHLSSARTYLANEVPAAVSAVPFSTGCHTAGFKSSSKYTSLLEEVDEDLKFGYSFSGRQQQGFCESDEGEDVERTNNRKQYQSAEREVLLIFLESYERSIEEDIAERSLNQNNILYEEHILESYSDMIDCFQLLGNSLMQNIIVNSDFLVICREKLTKILPIYNTRNIIINHYSGNRLATASKTVNKMSEKTRTSSTQSYLPSKFISSIKGKTNITCSSTSFGSTAQNSVSGLTVPTSGAIMNYNALCGNAVLAEPNDSCRTRSKTKLLLNQSLSSQNNCSSGNNSNNVQIRLQKNSSRNCSSMNTNNAKTFMGESGNNTLEEKKIMTRSATLKQQMQQQLQQQHQLDQKKDIDSYTSSTMEVEMADSQNEENNLEDAFDEEEEEQLQYTNSSTHPTQKRGKQYAREKHHVNRSSEKRFKKSIQKVDLYRKPHQHQRNINDENNQDQEEMEIDEDQEQKQYFDEDEQEDQLDDQGYDKEDEEEEQDDNDQEHDLDDQENDDEDDEDQEDIDEENENDEEADDGDENKEEEEEEIDEQQQLFSGFTKSAVSAKMLSNNIKWKNENRILQSTDKMNTADSQRQQNYLRLNEEGCCSSYGVKQISLNCVSQKNLVQVERKVLEELSIIYLRLSAFLTAVKFNPQKRNKEVRIMQIIKSLIEYKISSLFTDIFADSCLAMNSFSLSYSSLKEMVNSYRQQKVIIEISDSTDLSNIVTLLTDKTDIVINFKDKSLLKLEELESILCRNKSNSHFLNQLALDQQQHQQNHQYSTSEINSDSRHNNFDSNQASSFWKRETNSDRMQSHFFQKPTSSESQFTQMMELEAEENIKESHPPQSFYMQPMMMFASNEWFSQITSFEFKADLCRLGDEGTLMISNILEQIPSMQLKHLILSLRRNSISEQGIFGISRYVEKCKNLQTFRIFFSYNRIKDAGLTSILRSIVTLEQLQVLDLRFFDNQITAEGCQGFQNLQDVNFKDIKYLNMSLGNNQIGDEGCRLLSLFLCNIRNVKQLSIFLESNQINSSGIAHLKNVFVRKNQIKYLILHALSNKIEDDGIIKILDNIAKLTTLHSLEIILNENSLTEKAGVALGQTIKNMVNLTSLILSVRNNKISNKGVNSIGSNLKNLKNLESLVLSLTNNNIQGDGGVLIGKNLKYLTKLQKLHLVFYENSINHKSGKAIGEGLSNLKDLNYLILGIGDNNVGDEGAVAIGNCMLNLTKVKIFEIYLQNNEVGSNGASAIAKGLSNMRNLKCLVFQIQHSELGDQPMIELGKSLQNLKQLKSLDIYVERCNIGEEGGFSLGKGLYHLQNLKVMVLDLDSNSIGPRGGKALGDAFSNMHGLIDLKLYLKKNNMMPEGGQGLFEGIQHLRKLKSLNIDLYKNYTGDNSIITCGRALTLLKDLRNLELSITYNAITQTGAQQFSEYFGQCVSLHEVYLYMQKNNITPQGAEYIGNALSCLKDLQQLKISFGNNRIENQGISNLIRGVSLCESLRVLYLYAYNIGMTGDGCISIAQSLKKMKKLERFEFFPSANSQINLRNGLAQIAQSVIENHETLQNVRVDIPYWDENIKTFIKPRINNQIQTMQTLLFNRHVSNLMQYNPKAIHWDLFID